MANPEHLKILKQGVKAWNEWRKDNSYIVPDLSEAKLSGADLSKAFLFGVDLFKSNLTKANLSNAILSEADLCGANLEETNLKKASINKANLTVANLSMADLKNASLFKANLKMANLTGANLEETDLSRANFFGAVFIKANFSHSILIETNLIETNLNEAILTGIFFKRCSYYDWKIENVKCDYIFTDSNGKNRSPKERNFEPGEFERIYRSIPTIDLIFKNGFKPIDILILNAISEKLKNEKPNLGAELISFDKKGFYPKATFSAKEDELKENVKIEIDKLYNSISIQLSDQTEPDIKDKTIYNLVNYLTKYSPIQINEYNYGDKLSDQATKIELHDNAQINIEIKKILTDIQKEIDNTPAKSFKGKTKKQVKKIWDELITDVGKGALKEAGKKAYEFAKEELIPHIPSIASKLPMLLHLLKDLPM